MFSFEFEEWLDEQIQAWGEQTLGLAKESGSGEHADGDDHDPAEG